MQRQLIKDQLGALEEQLELLGPAARLETLEAFRDLHELIHSDALRRSLNANEFLARVSTVLIQQAAEQGYEIAISHYGEGRISAEMVEVSMGAIMACLRTSLRSYRGMGAAIRSQKGLFRACSIYLEVKGTTEGVHFRLIDDGKGYSGGFIAGMDADVQFQKLRAQIAAHGGWFSRQSFADFGGSVSFQVPLPRARFGCTVLRTGDFEILVPESYCTRVVDVLKEGGLPCKEGDVVALLCAETGLRIPAEGEVISPRSVVQISVADFQFWIICDSAQSRVRSRRYPCADFLEAGSWFQCLGLYPEGGALKSLPLLEGEGLMRFYAKWEAEHASV